ncbi:MAG: chromosome segregation SMC family protein [Pseudomonadota bacterium]|uniref:Chromosome partition protein Smc n=1 Tax=Sphingobium xenophagum TaxID=121428 RepID=A0A249MRD5_SPHXE|nr:MULTISPECIES: AAA family ATPase [Sphingobium]ASY43852.1 chromosome segregation protein [Sphingobium xenophagum]OUC55832.1 chromosome segregation protein [Sphingobium sp. GW456-12-10-14-TSB1]
MQIKRLKLSGFKSFVDATELRIEPGLTGIVGPNGCGKSNLLEAIRWVMGESSAKSMRGGGMEDVIFAGTATRPQRDFAEVSLLTVQEQGELFSAVDIGPDGELEVTRRIERGAGSAYRANGRDVRAKDVSLIFADAATGPHSPALVSQGRIAAVIAARPQERRAMLEEAAGIAGLHVRRKDAEQKLRAAETNLARLAEILLDMDARANALRRQARAAERYIRLSDQIRVAEARALFARWREAHASAETARAQAKEAEAAVAAAQDAQLAAAAHAQAALAALAERRAAAQRARDDASEAGHRLATLRTERDGVVRRLHDLAQQAARLDEDRAREGTLANDAADAIARLTAEIARLKARIAETEKLRPDFASRIASAEDSARDAELDLAKAMAKQAGEQAELRVAEAALVAARNRLERAEREVQRLSGEAAALPDPAPLEAQRAAAIAAQEQANVARDAAEAAIHAAEAARQSASEQRASAEGALSAARAALAALDSEAAALKRAVDSGPGGRTRALDQLKAAPGYERALAAALGDDLEAPIAPDGKRRWAGAPSLISDPKLPDGCAPLAAHVTAPPELARRLAQIAVSDRDEGQPLAVGQRLVTRDGQLRRWDGYVAMEGGAAAAERLIRLNRLEAIAANRPAVQAQVDAASTDQQQAKAREQSASESLASGRTQLAQADQGLRIALRSADEATTALERLAGRREGIEERLAEARRDADAARADHDSAQSARAAMPDGAHTRTLVATLAQASEKARAIVSQLQADQALADRALSSDRERQAAADAEIKGWRARAGEAAKRIAAMVARGDEIATERATIAGQPDALAQAIAALDDQGATLTAAADAARHAEQDAEAALRQAEQRSAQAGELFAAAREARATATARAESADERRIETNRLSGERFECPPPLLPEKLGFASADIRLAQTEQADHDRFTADRERIGPVNLVAALELEELEQVQASSRAESEELTQAIHRLRGSIGSLNREGRQRLLAAFEAVDAHFRRLFTTLFNGGQAHLELIDSDDPLESGLEIMAQPPGKKLAALTLLSGGEQALTAVALIFGLFLTNPAPICVLDEVDAPLDDANVERFCDLLDAMVAQTQTRYLIVTHNAVSMARMHRLFGVTMVERGVSRLVSVNLQSAEALLAAE